MRDTRAVPHVKPAQLRPPILGQPERHKAHLVPVRQPSTLFSMLFPPRTVKNNEGLTTDRDTIFRECRRYIWHL
jgi:hypothetical protein